MFGHLPRNANLALKAIIGIGGFAQLCEKAGNPEDANRYMDIAREYAAKWQELAKDDGHTRLAYDQAGSWSMKHNLIWDNVLGLNLIPAAVADAEIAWYLKVQKKYGLPVDHRTDTCLIDWALWSIAPARNAGDFQVLLDPIWRYANAPPPRACRCATGSSPPTRSKRLSKPARWWEASSSRCSPIRRSGSSGLVPAPIPRARDCNARHHHVG